MYGISLSGPEDDFVHRVEQSNEMFSKMKIPGAFLADTVPIMRYIPGWCPGGAAQRAAFELRTLSDALRIEPFDVVKRDMVRWYFCGPMPEC